MGNGTFDLCCNVSTLVDILQDVHLPDNASKLLRKANEASEAFASRNCDGEIRRFISLWDIDLPEIPSANGLKESHIWGGIIIHDNDMSWCWGTQLQSSETGDDTGDVDTNTDQTLLRWQFAELHWHTHKNGLAIALEIVVNCKGEVARQLDNHLFVV